MPSTLAVILALLLGVGSVGPAGAEDVTIVFRATGPEAPEVITHYYAAQHARFDAGNETTIVNFGAANMVRAFKDRKQFWEATFKEVEDAMTRVSAEMRKAMAGIPPGLRHKMLGDAEHEVTVTTGELRTIAGVPCQTYTLALSPTNRMQICAASSLSPPFDPKQFPNLILAITPVGPGNSGINRMIQKMRDIEGFFLASSTSLKLLGKRMESAAEATELIRGPVDPARFKLPRDFTQVLSPFAPTVR